MVSIGWADGGKTIEHESGPRGFEQGLISWRRHEKAGNSVDFAVDEKRTCAIGRPALVARSKIDLSVEVSPNTLKAMRNYGAVEDDVRSGTGEARTANAAGRQSCTCYVPKAPLTGLMEGIP